jgi:PAS domain S-box-containing protein
VAERRGIELTEALQRVALSAFVIDRNGVFTWTNDAATARFGDLVGTHYTVIVAVEDRPLAREQFARKLITGEPTEYGATLVEADGSRVRVEVSSVPIEEGARCQAVFGLVVVDREGAPPSPTVQGLTPRQAQVLALLAAGSSTDQIAGALTISRETVRNHVRHVLRALGAHSRLEAVATARAAGLLRAD